MRILLNYGEVGAWSLNRNPKEGCKAVGEPVGTTQGTAARYGAVICANEEGRIDFCPPIALAFRRQCSR